MVYRVYLLVVLAFVCACSPGNTNDDRHVRVEFLTDTSAMDYTLADTLGHRITFHRYQDSLYYYHVKFTTSGGKDENLSDLLPVIFRMWKTAADSINLQPKSLQVGYPLQYRDVLVRQVTAFSESTKWKEYLKTNGTKDNYPLVREIMLEAGVYDLDPLLIPLGYRMTDLSIEKVGFVLPERLASLGFADSLKIPVPYMVWIGIEKIKP